MKEFNPYISFPGNCKEALDFYKKIFKGTIKQVMYYKDSPMETPEDYKNKIMHSDFVGDKVRLMAADAPPGQPIAHGYNITLYLGFADPKEQTTLFKKLSEGGQIIMPLEDQFWGARFGILVDKFGISWMFNCQLKKTTSKKKTSIKKKK